MEGWNIKRATNQENEMLNSILKSIKNYVLIQITEVKSKYVFCKMKYNTGNDWINIKILKTDCAKYGIDIKNNSEWQKLDKKCDINYIGDWNYAD